MKNDKVEVPARWHSKDKTIARSSHHKDLFIVNHADGTWHSVASSPEIMFEKYPPAGQPRKSRVNVVPTFDQRAR